MAPVLRTSRSSGRDGAAPMTLALEVPKMSFAKLFIACLSLIACLATSVVKANATLPAGKGSFLFRDEKGNPEKPITVWYFKPAALAPAAKVVFVMHGVKRNGEEYRDNWTKYAEEHKFLLIVPEFPEQFYTKDEYQFGGVKNSRVEKWSFSAIEHLFDFIKSTEPIKAETYYLYGHSAGAQFVHRYMLFMPAPRVSLAISANAGSYTLPIYPSPVQPGFPWSLDKNIVSEEQLKAALSRNVVLMLGEEDTDENHKYLPRAAAAMAQGKNRLERGKNFYRLAQQQATALNVPFKWVLKTVPGVAHSDTGMAKVAVKYLFEN